MLITPVYAEPARDVAIDVAEDDSDDWDFPYSQGRGHLGWQTTMLAEEASANPNQMGSTSMEISLTSGVREFDYPNSRWRNCTFWITGYHF